jgi:hypothetical protein
MSCAFVKEAEDKLQAFPDCAISAHRNLVTSEGLGAIEAALVGFEKARREAITSNDTLAAVAAMREVRYWRARVARKEPASFQAVPWCNLKGPFLVA